MKEHDDTKKENKHNTESKDDNHVHEKIITHKKHGVSKKESISNSKKVVIALLAIVSLMVIFNQIQINQISSMIINTESGSSNSGSVNLADIDLSSIKSTGYTIATVFPIETWTSSDDVISAFFPSGTPDYGVDLGVSYDDPVSGLATLSKLYPALKQEIKTNNPVAWSRYVNMASRPVGITCEFCCGIGPVGTDQNGNLRGGCGHIKALNALALYLTAYTDYTDGEILREVIIWKAMFFPKKMVELGTSLIGGDTSSLNNLPGMVGGC